ncbi:hypothetical protein D9M68_837210 [compost metagenome]
MADEGGEACGDPRFDAPMRCNGGCRGALERVEQQGRCGKLLVAGAQHIGRADIARADLSDVAQPGHAGQDQSEWDRAEQIAEAQA